MLDEIQKRLLREIADLHTVPSGAYNIRSNSKLEARNTTANIDIVSKTEKCKYFVHRWSVSPFLTKCL